MNRWFWSAIFWIGIFLMILGTLLLAFPHSAEAGSGYIDRHSWTKRTEAGTVLGHSDFTTRSSVSFRKLGNDRYAQDLQMGISHSIGRNPEVTQHTMVSHSFWCHKDFAGRVVSENLWVAGSGMMFDGNNPFIRAYVSSSVRTASSRCAVIRHTVTQHWAGNSGRLYTSSKTTYRRIANF